MVVTPSNPRHPDHGVCRCPKCYDQFGYETPFDEQEILRLARLGAAVEARVKQWNDEPTAESLEDHYEKVANFTGDIVRLVNKCGCYAHMQACLEGVWKPNGHLADCPY